MLRSCAVDRIIGMDIRRRVGRNGRAEGGTDKLPVRLGRQSNRMSCGCEGLSDQRSGGLSCML